MESQEESSQPELEAAQTPPLVELEDENSSGMYHYILKLEHYKSHDFESKMCV